MVHFRTIHMMIQKLLIFIALFLLCYNVSSFQTIASTTRRCTSSATTTVSKQSSFGVVQASIAANIASTSDMNRNNGGNDNNNNKDSSSVSLLNNTTPPLNRHPSRKICLMVEPTPFTHVSGYANRFKEMLKFMKKAGDDVHILTVDSKTPTQQLPKEYYGYSISHTQGFTFPLYNHISLTIDLPEMKGAQLLDQTKPDIIHVTSPGFLVFAAMFYARVMKIPLVMSYHTHLPSYGTFIWGEQKYNGV
jgi:Glycosyltransferase Family 4